MANKLDDAQLAKEDIVSRPDITEGVEAQAQNTAPAAAENITGDDIERAERHSRIFARRLEKYLKKSTGDDVTADEAMELSEIGGMLFRGLLKVPFGSAIGGAIVAVCVSLPFLPRLLKIIYKPKPEEKKQ
jgi:hypothetical protein